MSLAVLLFLYFIYAEQGNQIVKANSHRAKFLEKHLNVPTYNEECKNVCDDLPAQDEQPVCMMYSRYKKGLQYFVNLCHARRAICKDNLLLHMVHPNRCRKSNQFFMPIS